MMNRYYKILLFLVMGILVAGCAEDMPDVPVRLLPDAPGTVTIRFDCSGMTRSAASDDSETRISNLLIGLYVSGPEEDVEPVAVKDVQAKELVTDEEGRVTVTMRLTDEMVEELFGGKNVSSGQCRIYALANRSTGEGAAELSENPTIAQMKALSVTSPSFKTQKVQPSFVMVGGGTVTYQGPTGPEIYGKASGTVLLSRAAAKIRLNVSLPKQIEVTTEDAEGNAITEKWEPVTNESMRVLLNNGVQTAVAYPVNPSGQPYWRPSDSEAYYNSELSGNPGTYRELTKSGSGDYPYTMDVPFYTYPNAWEELETSQTTLTLMVTWQKVGTNNSWQTYYYQVPVTPNDIQHIAPNYSYTVNLEVGMLGSSVPQTSQVVEGVSYQIVNWQTENVDVDINDYRYLVVNPNVISVQNENTVNIPYYSSHEIVVEDITMTFQRFNFFSDGNGDVVNIVVPQEILDRSVEGTQKMVSYEKLTSSTNQKSLRITHPMVMWTPVDGRNTEVALTGQRKPNDYNKMSEAQKETYMSDFVSGYINKFAPPTDAANAVPFSSYTFKITIRHEDNPNYKEDIVVTQYPGMYIEADRNLGEGTSGNVYVNNYTNNSNGDYGGVHGLAASNKNPNMYVIMISQLGLTSDYIIGDPRMEHTNNNLSTNNSAALQTATTDGAVATWGSNVTTFLYGTTGTTRRRLQYYYPTNESEDNQYKMRVAPKIRVASSYGVTNALGRTNMRKRIATYQEVNKPAGRWRLPTYGELLFIVQLSSTGKIPMLFNHYPDSGNAASSCYYWTAQGLYRVNSNGTLTKVPDTGTGGAKGIYDEWYWEQFPAPYSVLTPNNNGTYTYTLGDIPRGAIIGK